jgi:hypothetical protein
LEVFEVGFDDVLDCNEGSLLSRGSVLRSFFNLIVEIEIFINEKSKTVPELSDAEWILDLAFFVDITS